MAKKMILAFLTTALIAASLSGCGIGSARHRMDEEEDAYGTADAADDDGEDGSVSGDGGEEEEDEKITISMWGAQEDQDILRDMADAFVAGYKDRADITVELGICSEADAKDTVTADVEAAADVYAFASDQLQALLEAGALQEVSLNVDDIIEANGGAESGVIQAASAEGKLYAYPETADNGYFMIYNKEYFIEEDVETLDDMLKIASGNGKKVAMDMSSGWYNWSFFGGAGFELSLKEDRSNECDINGTSETGIEGVDVLQAMMKICAHKGFASLTSDEFAAGIQDGSVIAGVSGVWNVDVARQAWGENYAAAKLPTYTVDRGQIQMASFAGFKLVGVNPYSRNVGWSMRLAEWITNKENQIKRFEIRGAGPTNVEASSSEAVREDEAAAAFAAQSPYSILDGVQSDNFWDPMSELGGICIEGNPEGSDLQDILDRIVEAVTQPVETE